VGIQLTTQPVNKSSKLDQIKITTLSVRDGTVGWMYEWLQSHPAMERGIFKG